MNEKRKQSLYFPEDMLNEILVEADRQDRSVSWIVQQAWKIAREQVKKLPGTRDIEKTQVQSFVQGKFGT